MSEAVTTRCPSLGDFVASVRTILMTRENFGQDLIAAKTWLQSYAF